MFGCKYVPIMKCTVHVQEEYISYAMRFFKKSILRLRWSNSSCMPINLTEYSVHSNDKLEILKIEESKIPKFCGL